ncbi:MAG: glyoxalase-like protein [Nocardia sp.]|uniref:VOC family protein n=1 Tax=Nocardia sp. TaxID=1821 RepID=UPI00260B069E|nr:VOC family protein [Nocardia sp.]MCU1648367.1 glyoxalase-like protein [Nocardia sp.]
MTKTTCSGVLTVAVPVTDQDRAKALWQQLGFETHMDAELQPDFRWLEMRIPGTDTTLSFVRASEELPAGIDTGIRLATPDARAAHTALADLGFTVGSLLEWETAPPMFMFRDPDGNRFYITQTD